MTGTNCDLFTYKSSRSYLNHLVFVCSSMCIFSDLFTQWGRVVARVDVHAEFINMRSASTCTVYLADYSKLLSSTCRSYNTAFLIPVSLYTDTTASTSTFLQVCCLMTLTLDIWTLRLLDFLPHVYWNTRWLKYDRDKLWLVYTQIVPVIFEPPCIIQYLSGTWSVSVLGLTFPKTALST
jgi:hypothetical protein